MATRLCSNRVRVRVLGPLASVSKANLLVFISLRELWCRDCSKARRYSVLRSRSERRSSRTITSRPTVDSYLWCQKDDRVSGRMETEATNGGRERRKRNNKRFHCFVRGRLLSSRQYELPQPLTSLVNPTHPLLTRRGLSAQSRSQQPKLSLHFGLLCL
jgi:hypothetical protein